MRKMPVILNRRRMVRRKMLRKRTKMTMTVMPVGRLTLQQRGRGRVKMIQTMMTVERMTRDHPSDRVRPLLGLRSDH
jgi:hypothetical protein